MSGAVIVVEGEIGAGKTELTKAIAAGLAARGLNVCSILEPVDLWKGVGILQKFYENPGRYAYGFQTYVYATRVLAIADAVKANPTADIFLLERSPATDTIFMYAQRGLVDPVEMSMYRTWCDLWRQHLPLDLSKAKVLYLKTSLGQCMARVASRRRDGEIPAPARTAPAHTEATATGGVSLEYQRYLRRLQEAFFQGLHAGEFPDMPSSPYPASSVFELGPELADGNFRDEGAERDRIVAAVIARASLA